MNYPDISIIIVNYNSFSLLHNCLASIIEHTKGIFYEILVIDNNSTEGDVADVIKNFSNTKLIKNEFNAGFAAANNQGFGIAQGKYFLILNNDTVFHSNIIKELYDFTEFLNQEVFVGCKLLNEDGSHQISLVDFDNILNTFGENFFLYKIFPKSKIFNRFHKNQLNPSYPIEVDIVKGAFIFCTASAIRRLKGFDTNFFFYAEETDLCYRFKKTGGKVYYYPNSSIYHLGGATTDKNLWFKFKNQSIAKIQIYQKHFSGMEFFLLIAIHYAGIFIRVPIYFFAGLIKFNFELIKKSYYYLKQMCVYPKNKFKYSGVHSR